MPLTPEMRTLSNHLFANAREKISSAIIEKRMAVIKDAQKRGILQSGIYWTNRLRVEEEYLRRMCEEKAQSHLTVIKEAGISFEDEHIVEIMSEVSGLAHHLVASMTEQLEQAMRQDNSPVRSEWARGNLARVAESTEATIRRNLVIQKGLQKLRQQAAEHEAGDEVFVIMSFKQDLNEVYEQAIQPAIIECALRPFRVDKEESEGTITEAILARIKSSRLVVADLTYERPNCYYELGFAAAVGKPCIIAARADHNPRRPERAAGDPKVHFDLDSHKISYWDPDALGQLKQELVDRMKNVLGQST